jgi:uncharacterized protein involved in response to NO
MALIPRLKAHDGPALSYGFRPFAAAARICAAAHPAFSASLLHVAAFAWAAAFLGFAVSFGPSLMRPRPSGAAT